MKKTKIEKEEKMNKTEKEKETKEKESECKDKLCPFHGSLAARGMHFKGNVIKIFEKRAVIGKERIIYHAKYERYEKKKSKFHAHIPDCIKIAIGDKVQISECRPISKIQHFVVIKKILGEEGK